MKASRATGFLTQADVSRSVKAARAAGLDVLEVEINWPAGKVTLKTRSARTGEPAGIDDDASTHGDFSL